MKREVLEIFSNGEEEQALLTRLRQEINDRLLVSKEVFTNPGVYKYLREALESRRVRVPVSVVDTTAGSFVAKRIIAAIWSDANDKVKRDALPLEYHNLRQLVVNSNMEILSEQLGDSTQPEINTGPSSSSRRSSEGMDNTRRTLDRLTTEEKKR